MLSAHMDSDFEHTVTHHRYGLPVARLSTILNEVELAAGFTTRRLRKASQIIERRAPPNNRPLVARRSMQFAIWQLDILAAMGVSRWPARTFATTLLPARQ